jgi:mannose-6-phosphate isomerase-like protein (cupin superfamily)
MRIINTNQIAEYTWSSPGGKFAGSGKGLSEELGRNPQSMDLNERHPFDVEIMRIPPGKTPCPFHSHSAQWEFYHVLTGHGTLRHAEGLTEIGPGDAFVFKPNEPHQLINSGEEDLVVYVVADNPIGESFYYPDSGKWGVPIPQRTVIRSSALDYYDGEE